MPLDPQVKRYLETQAPASPDIGVRRQTVRTRLTMEVEDIAIPGPAGAIPARVYRAPGARPLPILVYYHGGGFITGELDTHDSLCRLLAGWGRCLVVHVNYRHAPEHQFPAALDDAYAGLRWVADNAASLGGDPSRIAVGGDSAGGSLSIGVSMLAKEQGDPRVIFQLLMYPATDAVGLDTESMKTNATGFGFTREAMVGIWNTYLRNDDDRLNPLVSPLRAPDLSGLPPALVITAEFDPLRDEGEAFAVRLRDAGVPVEQRRYDGMVHGFFTQLADVDAAKLATIDATNALQKAFSKAE